MIHIIYMISYNLYERKFQSFKSITKSADEVSLLSLKDFDDFFEKNKGFLLEYLGRIRHTGIFCEIISNMVFSLFLLILENILTLTRPIGLPPHAPVAQKNADQR